MAEASSETISVYLLRVRIRSAEHALRDDVSALEQHRIRGLGDDAVLYVRRRPAVPPKWAEFFTGAIAPPLDLKRPTFAAVLIVKASRRLFAITFGAGARFMLELGSYERNFGLRVAANSVEPDHIRSVQSRSYVDTALQIRRQVAEVSDIVGLQMDVQRDLLTRLEGSVRPDALGKRIAGADAVRLTDSLRPRELKSVCSRLLKASRLDTYKRLYPWIDWLSEVTDSEELAELELDVLERLLSGEFDCFDVYPPEMVNEDVVDFRTGRGTVVMEPTRALLEKTVARIGAKDPVELSEGLKHRYIAARNAEGIELKQWSWWECLYFETQRSGRTVVLDRGAFFRVRRQDARTINDFAKALQPSGLNLPDAMWSEIEPDYNSRVAKERDDLLLLDRKLVQPLAGESRIEICDPFSEGGHLVHVKRGKGGSSGLSHLFAQASVTSRLLRSEPSFPAEVRKQLGTFSARLADPPVPSENPVVLAVIVAAEGKGEGAAALPFFSKVFLRQNVQALVSMSFPVHYDEIPAPLTP